MPSHGEYNLPILITGAAGRVGSVGRLVAAQLLERGFRVRAQVRTEDDRAAALHDLGAEVVVGDLLDLETVHRAVEGCERVYCGLSIAPTYLEAAINIALVAKHHHVSAFINMSQMTVREMDIYATTTSPQQRQHWLFEQVLAWSGLPVVEVRPTAFLEGLFLQLAGGVASRDHLLAPLGRGKNSAIAACDVARSITTILVSPAEHIGKTYHLTGPISQDMPAIAKEFSEALGRSITYVDVPISVWKEMLPTMGLSPHLVAHVITMAELHQANRYDRYTDDVEKLTGQRPMSVRTFVKQNAQIFTSTRQS